MKRTLLVLTVLAGLLAGMGTQAFASSCTRGDPRNAIDRAPGAFIGSFESKRTAYGRQIFRFRVERVLKGRIGQTVDVVERYPNAPGGSPAESGRIGLVLGRQGNSWVAGACSDYDPDVLLAAAGPLPRPDGRGPAGILLGTTWGAVRAMTLDVEGRVLRYGFDGPRISTMSMCPGGRRVVLYGESQVAVREPVSLRLVSRMRMPEIAASSIGTRSASPVLCRDPDGRDVAVFQTNRHQPVSTAQLLVYNRGRLVHQVRGSWMHAVFSPDRRFVWLSGGRYAHEISRVDMASGRVEKMLQIPIDPRVKESRRVSGQPASADVSEIAGAPDISPDGSTLALRTWVAGPQGYTGPARHMLIDVSVRPPRVRSQDVGGVGVADPRWIDERRFLVASQGGTASVYDTSFKRVGGFPMWTGGILTISGGIAWGPGWAGEPGPARARTAMYAAQLPSGPVRAFLLPDRGSDFGDMALTGPAIVLASAKLPRGSIDPFVIASPEAGKTTGEPSKQALPPAENRRRGRSPALPVALAVVAASIAVFVLRRRLG